MNNTLFSAWDGKPPTILAISQPMPNAPYLPLSGGCTTRMSLENFFKDVECDFQKQQGSYYAYVFGGNRDEADTYTLETWEVCHTNSGCYEAIVILYYSPINPYLTIKKHLGDDLAE
ncbi:MAG TPA: hypothetical protein VK184_17445 [Nostocaceae cyanobacterium]|nr:hypothetical protein [Nostocaceae cyanobacterium]